MALLVVPTLSMHNLTDKVFGLLQGVQFHLSQAGLLALRVIGARGATNVLPVTLVLYRTLCVLGKTAARGDKLSASLVVS